MGFQDTRGRGFLVVTARGAVGIGTVACRGQGLDGCDQTEHESRTAAG